MCPSFGVYPVADAKTAGEEISSVYEGRHLTLLESEITHPEHADGFVDKGDPVVVGNKIVGVAFKSAAAATDLIAIDTEGIWVIDVLAEDDSGNNAVAGGDELFINTTTCVVSKIRNIATQIPFGYALGIITGGNTDTIAIKVHHDPTVDSHIAQFTTTVSGGYGKSMRAEITGASEGICGYYEGHLVGAQTGHLYNFGSWINIDNGVTGLTAGRIVVPYEGGIYCGEAQANLRAIFAGQHMAILGGAPSTLHAWRLNTNQVITALIAAANPGSVGYDHGKAGTGVVGTIPIADVVGHGVVYIDVHAAVA